MFEVAIERVSRNAWHASSLNAGRRANSSVFVMKTKEEPFPSVQPKQQNHNFSQGSKLGRPALVARGPAGKSELQQNQAQAIA